MLFNGAHLIRSLRLKTYAQLAELKVCASLQPFLVESERPILLQSLSIAVNALAAAGDLIIAASLCIILHQSRTGFQRYVKQALNSKLGHIYSKFLLVDPTR